MNIYYHINKNIDCGWKAGDEIEFGKEENNYWKSLSGTDDLIEIDGEEFDVHLIAMHAFKTYVNGSPPPTAMKGYHFNPMKTLHETIDSLGNALKICRELAFESIRKEFYPELPSRLNCIWLIPDNLQSLTFWKNVIPNGHQKIFKIVIDGKIHRAAQKWLIGGTYSVNKWSSLAHSYWNGEGSGNKEDEILFKGKIKILEEL